MENKLSPMEHLTIFKENLIQTVRANPKMNAEQKDEAVHQIENSINEMLEKVMLICTQ